jgi:hypothetical protein
MDSGFVVSLRRCPTAPIPSLFIPNGPWFLALSAQLVPHGDGV